MKFKSRSWGCKWKIGLLIILVTTLVLATRVADPALAATSAPPQKLVPAQTSAPASVTYSKNFVVLLSIYGIKSNTGQLFAFVNAHNMTKSTIMNATDLEKRDNLSVGIGQIGFTFPNLVLKPGEPYTACVVTLNDARIICTTDYKTPYPRAEYPDISIQ